MLLGRKKVRRIAVLTITSVCIVAIVGVSFLFQSKENVANAAWYSSSWDYRVKLTINANQVAGVATVVVLTSGSSWTVPSDWNSASNTIQVIGGGGGGGRPSNAQYNGASGGGGGAYSSVSNLSLTPGASVSYQVGSAGAGGSSNGASGGTGGDTWIGATSMANCVSAGATSCVGAKGGTGGAAVTTAGVGGVAASGVGSTKYSGGDGGVGTASAASPNNGSGGGGGAAGPNGNGGAGGDGGTGGVAGTGNAGGGGGGSNGGYTGGDASASTPAAGGNNRNNTGGGSAGAVNGGTGSNGGGGGGGDNGATAGTGGTGSQDTVMSTYGPGGGGGGAGGANTSGTSAAGGSAGGYGGGGGAGGNAGTSANGGSGTQGLIVINYTPVMLDFPVYVDLSDLPQHVWDNMRSDCGDIRITTVNGSTEVPREIVTCDSGGQTGEMHFKAPELSTLTNTDFYIYYGNSGQGDYAIDATYGAENVWTNGYVGVYHLNQDPGVVGSGGFLDSTTNDRDGTDEGTMTSGDLVTGQMGNAIDFDGTDDNIAITGRYGDPANLTTTVWLSLRSPDTTGAMAFSIGDSMGIGADYSTQGASGFMYNGSAWTHAITNEFVAGAGWHHVAYSHNDTGDAQISYVNGVNEGTSAVTGAITYNQGSNSNIGEHANAGVNWNFNGIIDEVRVSNVVRTADWIRTEYNNQSTPGAFYAIGDNDTTRIFLTTGTTWVVPDDWNSASNTIEAIGGGGSGGVYRVNNTRYGTGGGGGGYAKATNVSLTPGGTVTYAIGSGGAAVTRSTDGGTAGNAGGDTYFCSATTNCASIAGTSVEVGAKGGSAGAAGNSGSVSGGSGGPTANAVGGSGGGTTNPGGSYAYAGGSGGSAVTPGSAAVSTGGGGAAGPYGAGGNGTDRSSDGGSAGGTGGNSSGGAGGSGGSGGTVGSLGSPGTEWGSRHGSGGGSGGLRTSDSSSGVGRIAGNYGGGGGGITGNSGTQVSSPGEQGVIVITYTPSTSSLPDATFFSSSPTNISTTTITMVATSTDQGGNIELESGNYLEYYFTINNASCGANAGTGGTSSGWIATSTYTDSGLQPNKCYGYTVTARDGLGNVSATSTASTTYTSAVAPDEPRFSGLATTSAVLYNNGGRNSTSSPATLFTVQASSSDAVWNGKYVDTDGSPSASAVWLSDSALDGLVVTSLDAFTAYDFRAKARNNDGEETSFGSYGSIEWNTLVKYEFTGGTLAPTIEFGAEGSTITNDQSLVTWEFPANYSYETDPELRLGPETSAVDSASAITNDSYFTITVTPDVSNVLYFTSLDFKVARGGVTTPRGWVVRSSADSYASNLGSADIASQRPTWTDISVDLSGVAFQTVTAPITFRIYVYAPTNASTIEIDDITFYGTSELDSIPPTPDPMTFAVAPDDASATSIDMVATTGVEATSTPVQYYFTVNNTSCGANAGTGGTDSGWQTSTLYTDTGLQANKCYGYTVTARDSGGNAGATSSVSTTYTAAATPGAPEISESVGNTFAIDNTANSNPSSNPTTLFTLRMGSTTPIDNAWEGKYIDSTGNPTTTAVWLSDAGWDAVTVHGAVFGTSYSIASKARNADGEETPFGSFGSILPLVNNADIPRVQGGTRLQGGARIQ